MLWILIGLGLVAVPLVMLSESREQKIRRHMRRARALLCR